MILKSTVEKTPIVLFNNISSITRGNFNLSSQLLVFGY